MISPKFDCYANMIKVLRDKNIAWELIDYLALEANESDDEHLKTKLGYFSDLEGLPKITCQEWHDLVEDRKGAEESGAAVDDGGLFVDYEPNNEAVISEKTVGPQSCWQQYKRKLREEKHFTLDAVERLEDECKWIVNRIRLNTKELPTSIKGLVVGNVQSGKTANMAGVISMAADIGFNFFVVLAGRVTNLRKQTSDRLIDDVKPPQGSAGLDWRPFIEMLRPNIQHLRLQDFSWVECEGGMPNRHRYLTVCLKEPNWLKNLLKWLQADGTNAWMNTGLVKMLIIDDECDQASVNTRDVESELQTTIFKYIAGLCNHMMPAAHGQLQEGHPYAAVNYLGYTATPYANILNDANPRKSLYPRDFIKPLKPSPSYWGPNQIFGPINPTATSEFEDRPFLCEIPDDDVEGVRAVHRHETIEVPASLKDAINWFVCASAARRFSGTKSPVSMLVHTSNAVNDHAAMAGAVARYLRELKEKMETTSGEDEVLSGLRKLYKDQCDQLTLEAFNDTFIEYQPKEGEVVADYPPFDDLVPRIKAILLKLPTQIQIAQDATGSTGYEFSDAIHLCVDNSDNNANIDDGKGNFTTMRIHYPTKDDPPPPCAPLFIVIGGNTLARGLTLEGLVSSYFLRTVRTCDSLMQMGRWFGYRFGYELLPRVWMTSECVLKFAHLTMADLDLRQRFEEGVALGKKPVDMQACMIDTSDAIRGFTVTSKNKMQMSEVAEADYSCTLKMPYWFSTEQSVLDANRDATERLVDFCASSLVASPQGVGSYYYCDNVPFEKIEAYLSEYRFLKRTKDFSDREALLEYLCRKLSDRPWTVVVSGEKKQSGQFDVLRRNYSNRKDVKCPNGVIAFRHVTEPSDFIADIDPKTDFPGRVPKRTQSKAYRCAATKGGKDKTPVLVITRFNADTLNRLNSGINITSDLYGFALYLPSVADGELKSHTMIRCRNLVRTEDEPESEV